MDPLSPARALLRQDATPTADRRQVQWTVDRLPVTNPGRYQSRMALVQRGGAFQAVPR